MRCTSYPSERRIRHKFGIRLTRNILIAVGVLVLVQGCAAKGTSQQELGQTQPLPPTSPETQVPAPITVSVREDFVQDCVDSVQFGAFTHDPTAEGVWNQAGGETSALRQLCHDLGVSNPARLSAISVQWQATKQYLATAPVYAPPQAPRPVTPAAPLGATAICNDGSYSFSQHRSGTCSHHGGVAVWL